MKPILIAGISIVNLALISYSIAILSQRRKKLVSGKILTFLTIGVTLDITATVCMIIGSGNFLTLHGIIGYSSFAGMFSDTLLSHIHAKKYGIGSALSEKFNRWSLIAYVYWVLAYITGALLVMLRG
jgi:hypothetical protein